MTVRRREHVLDCCYGRPVSAEEVAGAVAYLAGPLPGSTKGTSIAADGGMLALRLRQLQG
jgi:hypothetical protein